MKKVVFICLLLSLISCKNSEKNIKGVVVGSQNTEKFAEIKKLNLNDSYNNLLNPKFSSEEDYKEVLKTWNDFHQQVGKIVKENNFDWGTKDSSVVVFNRIYFNKKGEVDYYTFKIGNKNVSKAKRIEYEKLLSENISKVKIDLKRDVQYAQCGKVRYKNYE